MKYIKRKSAVKPITGSIVDTTNIDDKTSNTYSANVIDKQIGERILAFHDVKKVYMGCDFLGQKNSSFNLNNLKAGECCYYFSNTDVPVNIPVSMPGINYMVYCFEHITSYGNVQFVLSDGYDTNIYIRNRWGPNWGNWRKITASAI